MSCTRGPIERFHFSNGLDVSGYQDRSLNVFPLLLDARYFIRLQREMRPFVGLGIGAYIITQRLDIGLSSYSTTEWHFGLAPEAGLLFPLGSGTDFTVSVRYDMPFGSGSQGFFQFLGLHLGIGWGNWP
jgi:outer membrane protein W